MLASKFIKISSGITAAIEHLVYSRNMVIAIENKFLIHK